MPHFHNAMEQVQFSGGKTSAFRPGSIRFNFLKNFAIFGFEVLVDAYIIYQFVAWFVFVISIECFEQLGVGAGASCGIVQVGIECLFYIARENFLAQERNKDVPELCFPFVAMRLRLMLEVEVGEHVCQLVQQRNEEAVLVQVCIYCNAVVRHTRHWVPVVAKHRPSLVGERKVDDVSLKERGYLFIRTLRQKLL